MKEELLELINNYFENHNYHFEKKDGENDLYLKGKIGLGSFDRNFTFYLPKDENDYSFRIEIELGRAVIFTDNKKIFKIVSDYFVEDSITDLEMDDEFGISFVVDPFYKISVENYSKVLDKFLFDLNIFLESDEFKTLDKMISPYGKSFINKNKRNEKNIANGNKEIEQNN